ncbi:MAG: DUF4384 domain-containing protein [Verrucomicrobiales bacterium]|nr:DUF4384 domain-containing protein [Verrucomicrobiales bacterium]
MADTTTPLDSHTVSVQREDGGGVEVTATFDGRGMAWYRGLPAGSYRARLEVQEEVPGLASVPTLGSSQTSSHARQPGAEPLAAVRGEAMKGSAGDVFESGGDVPVAARGVSRRHHPEAVHRGVRELYEDLLEYNYKRPLLAVAVAAVLLLCGIWLVSYFRGGQLPTAQLLALLYPPSPTYRGAGETGDVSLALQIFVSRDRSAASVPLPEGGSISGRDGYYLEVLPEKVGDLYVFQLDEMGRISWLFPTNAFAAINSFGRNPVSAHQRLRIPPEPGRGLQVDPSSGSETVFAVLAREPWPALTNLLARAASPPLSTDERVRSGAKRTNAFVRGENGPARPPILETATHTVVRQTFQRVP